MHLPPYLWSEFNCGNEKCLLTLGTEIVEYCSIDLINLIRFVLSAAFDIGFDTDRRRVTPIHAE